MHAAVAKKSIHGKAGLGSDLGVVRKVRAEKAFGVAKKLLTDHLPESTRQNESQCAAYEEMIVILGSALGRAINMLGQDKRLQALTELRKLHPDTCDDKDQKELWFAICTALFAMHPTKKEM